MEMALVVVAVVVVIAALMMMRSRNWKTMLVGSGSTAEEVRTKYAYLKENQIKCKLSAEDSPTMGAVQGGGSYNEALQSVKLQVHNKDVDRATELLEVYSKEADLSLSGL